MDIYLHIGLHKTGTTFLQRKVFPNLKGINYAFKWDFHNKIRNFKEDLPVLFSSEEFCAAIYGGKIVNNFFDDFQRSINILNKIFYKPKIVIGFREPSEMINSFYKQTLHGGEYFNFEDYFSLKGKGILPKEDMMLGKYLTLLTDTFGEDKVFSYNYEVIKKDFNRFLKEFCKFLNIDTIENNFFNNNKYINKGVFDNLEKYLKKYNKINHYSEKTFNFSFNNVLFKKLRISPRPLFQKRLLNIVKQKKLRDLSEIKSYYSEDWNNLRKQLTLDIN